jgi:CRP-like cAMP-binding protein
MPEKNRLLAALASSQAEFIANNAKPVPLTFKAVLHEPGEAIEMVYFPRAGVVSLVNEPQPGEIVEVGTVGREGFVGFPLLLNSDAMLARAIVQIPGDALQMPARAFLRLVGTDEAFHAFLMRYTLALLTQIAQNASCNRLHEVQERCARWLLQTHDRVDGDSFALTQEFLAQMLGVHRPTVTIAAGMLQAAGLIEYTRGTINILNRNGLESAACHCYRLVADEYKRLLQT